MKLNCSHLFVLVKTQIVIRSLFDSSLVSKQQHVYSKDASEGAADKKYE